MTIYYVNKKPEKTGEHLVHKKDCSYRPSYEICDYLGYFAKPTEAVAQAEIFLEKVEACPYCCKENE